MKNRIKTLTLILIIIFCLLQICCEKGEITPGSYTPTPTPEKIDSVETIPFVDGGTIPTFPSGFQQNNELVGTSWVLTEVKIDFGTSTMMDDTLHFLSNGWYYVNSDSTYKARYLLYNVQNNVTLTFQPFIPMNYIMCSTNELGDDFVSGGQIIGVNFVNQYNTVSSFKAWFTKI